MSSGARSGAAMIRHVYGENNVERAPIRGAMIGQLNDKTSDRKKNIRVTRHTMTDKESNRTKNIMVTMVKKGTRCTDQNERSRSRKGFTQ